MVQVSKRAGVEMDTARLQLVWDMCRSVHLFFNQGNLSSPFFNYEIFSSRYLGLFTFLAVQNSSIGDLVTHSLSQSLRVLY